MRTVVIRVHIVKPYETGAATVASIVTIVALAATMAITTDGNAVVGILVTMVPSAKPCVTGAHIPVSAIRAF